METYGYTGNLRNITTGTQLGTEGVLTGEYGSLHFRRCEDGLAIIDSGFPGSGFVCWPTSENFSVPGFVNDIPVTEIRREVSARNNGPIAIEAPELKRAYLRISRAASYAQDRETGDIFSVLERIMARDQKLSGQNRRFLEISISFHNADRAVEYCEIQCGEKCVLSDIAAKHLCVRSPAAVLKDRAYTDLERADFSGKVYPFAEEEWGDLCVHTGYFSERKKLKSVDGSLRGDTGWCFSGCESLETVHLSDGIRKILPYAFSNCTSLTDIFIPDTVTEIGKYAFAGCKNLRTIHLPAGLRRIPEGMFKGCASLTKCFLSDEIEYIDNEAFKGCAALRKPWIPANIKQISETAFDNPEWGRF